MNKINRKCPDCGEQLEKTPLDSFYYCNICNKSISINHPELQKQEVFIEFNNMHTRSKELRKQLETENGIVVSAEGRAYEVIGWPKSGKNKVYQRHCSDEFGKNFKKANNEPLTREDKELIEKYLLQVDKTKLFGDILITYAKLRDTFTDRGLEFDNKLFGVLLEDMRKIYASTDCPKEIEDIKPRRTIKLGKKVETK